MQELFCKYELMSTFYSSPTNVDNDFCSRFANHKFCIYYNNAKQFTFIYNQDKHLLSKKYKKKKKKYYVLPRAYMLEPIENRLV